MKKIYSLAIALLSFGFAANAQLDLSSTLVKPTTGTTWDAGTYYDYELTVTVVSGSVISSDTVWYGFTDGSKIYGRTGLTKSVGDTISFKNSIGYGTGRTPASNYKWCSWTFATDANGIKNDPTHSNDSSCTTINITNTVGIGSGPSTASASGSVSTLSLVPNPARDVVGFHFQSGNNTAVQTRVVDVTGRTILRSTFNNNADGNYKIDVSSLGAGIYFVEVIQGEDRSLGKFTKQ